MRWLRKLGTAFRLLTWGRVELGNWAHAPLAEAAWPGDCICGLPVGDDLHGAAGKALAARLGVTR